MNIIVLPSLESVLLVGIRLKVTVVAAATVQRPAGPSLLAHLPVQVLRAGPDLALVRVGVQQVFAAGGH